MPKPASILDELELFGVKLGLDRIGDLLAGLGAPQRGLPVVLVGGTNGKGSTATVLASITGAAGYRTGLYTSPHLESVEERIRIGGVAIDPDELGELLEQVVAVGRRTAGVPPTYFEALTAAAVLHFRREDVELGVLEVGLGGRLDATNACDPVLSLVTSISRDHEWVLGEGVERIAVEKAGIVRPGRRTITWIPDERARIAFDRRAAEIGGIVVDGRDLASWSRDAEGRLVLRSSTGERALRPALDGEHQLANVGLAAIGAEHLAGLGFARAADGIPEGVAAARWPGRLERVVLDGGRWVLLDGAHNHDSSRCLRLHLERAGEPHVLVFGVLRDKPAGEMLGELVPGAVTTLLVRPDDERGVEPSDLLETASASGAASVCTGLDEALRRALAAPERGVVVCGSLYLVGAARRWLRERFGRPQAAVEVKVAAGVG